MRQLKLKLKRKSLGQGMTEYIIIVALIAIAAVGVYNLFGKTVRNQMAGVANGLAGADSTAKTAIGNAGTAANNASSDANNQRGLDSFADSTGKK
ncbi:pilus assembly protein [Ralstonia sp. UBA689]|uniref:pilus assembly protein n=1 Tax=Ralstonia sp. UBA689 TaxID=1947373 RepID=UPI0025D467A2|nr:pilus assembly protein [Ralstonia sp. UBA689]